MYCMRGKQLDIDHTFCCLICKKKLHRPVQGHFTSIIIQQMQVFKITRATDIIFLNVLLTEHILIKLPLRPSWQYFKDLTVFALKFRFNQFNSNSLMTIRVSHPCNHKHKTADPMTELYGLLRVPGPHFVNHVLVRKDVGNGRTKVWSCPLLAHCGYKPGHHTTPHHI